MAASRPTSVDEYVASLVEPQRSTVATVLHTIAELYPESTVKLAWNVPQVQIAGKYVFGIASYKQHIALAPWSEAAMAACADQLSHFTQTLALFRVPVDWQVDRELLRELIAIRLGELDLSR